MNRENKLIIKCLRDAHVLEVLQMNHDKKKSIAYQVASVAPPDVSEQPVCWTEEMVLTSPQMDLHHPILRCRYHSLPGYHSRAHPIHLRRSLIVLVQFDRESWMWMVHMLLGQSEYLQQYKPKSPNMRIHAP
jgi:hypothetical protein